MGFHFFNQTFDAGNRCSCFFALSFQKDGNLGFCSLAFAKILNLRKVIFLNRASI